MTGLALVTSALAFGQPVSVDPTPTEHGTSLDVVALLGRPDAGMLPPPSPGWSAGFDVEVDSSLACGQLRANFDLNASVDAVSELPAQLVDLGRDLFEAAPMLAYCQLSPSGCQFLKETSQKIREDLDLRANACRAIDAQIGTRADEGTQIRRAARQLAVERCIRERGTTREAVQQCTEHPSRPAWVPDLRQGFAALVRATGDQDLTKAALESTQHRFAFDETVYALLRAIGGEIRVSSEGRTQVQVDGDGITVASDVADTAVVLGARVACDPAARTAALDNTVPLLRGAELRDRWARLDQAVREVLRDRLLATHHRQLLRLPTTKRQIVCTALGRTLAREAMRRTHDEVASLLRLAAQNPAVRALGAETRFHDLATSLAASAERLEHDEQIQSYADWARSLQQAVAELDAIDRAITAVLAAPTPPPTCRSLAECQVPREVPR